MNQQKYSGAICPQSGWWKSINCVRGWTVTYFSDHAAHIRQSVKKVAALSAPYAQFSPNQMLSVVLFPVLLAAAGVAHAGFEDRTFEEFRLNFTKDAGAILINSNLCSSIGDCGRKKLIFTSPWPKGFSVQIYGVTDNDSLKKITNLCAEYFWHSKAHPNIFLSIYYNPKDHYLESPIWKSTKPNYTVTYKED